MNTNSFAFALVALVGMLSLGCGGSGASSFEGHVYVGPPTGQTSYSGCEGCGQPGELRFTSAEAVEFVAPGSDIVEIGTYSQAGDRVHVTTDEGSALDLTVTDGGEALVEAGGLRLTRSR